MPSVYEEALEITVYGDPVPWAAQARVQKTGFRFTPARQTQAVGRIIAAVRSRELEPLPAGQPVLLAAEFVVKRPKGHYGSGRNAGKIKEAYRDAWPTGRPDLSNLLKLLEDALVQSNLLPDDDQVVQLGGCCKRYQDSPDDPVRSVAYLRAVTRASVKSVTIPGMQKSLLGEGSHGSTEDERLVLTGSGGTAAGVRGH